MKPADQSVALECLQQALTDYREMKKSVAGLRDLELIAVQKARTDENCSKELFEKVLGAINAQGQTEA